MPHIVEGRAVIIVDVADGDRAAGRHRRIADIAFVDGPVTVPVMTEASSVPVIVTMNLLGRAVGRRVGDRVVDDVAGIEVLDGRLIERVRPGAAGQDETAIDCCRRRSLPTSLKVGLSSSSTSLMAIEPVAVTGASPILPSLTAPGHGTGDDRRIVRAGDRHRDLLGRAVCRRVGDRVVDDVPGVEVLDGRLIQRVRPGAAESARTTP